MRIFIKTRFVALHRWPEASYPVSFLSSPHRHEFHVKAFFDVGHDNRELEFFTKKIHIDDEVEKIMPFAETFSCEQWSRGIGLAVGACSVEVSEDGENGAVWARGDES